MNVVSYTDAPWCWYIYLQNWEIFRANVGKYSIHGAYDIVHVKTKMYTMFLKYMNT
jgi:hypothetical protein